MNNKGKKYEKQALSYLKQKGLRLIEKNYQTIYGEIDIVMRDADVLVFIEVRARANKKFGSAIDTITKTKQNKIINSAKKFVTQKDISTFSGVRFDVIGIEIDKNCKWIQDAFTIDG